MTSELLSQLINSVTRLKEPIIKLKKYKGNQHYQKTYEKEIRNLNREYTYFKAKIKKIEKKSLHTKIENVDLLIYSIMNDRTFDKKMNAIKKLELFWPELEVEFIDDKSLSNTFEIPKEIPMNEQRLDLEEAIRDYNNGCYISSLVLCRRSYDGSLVRKYQSMTRSDPVSDVLCSHCGKIIRSKSYMGIGKLHNWAIKSKVITEKLKQVGFLVSDIGAGGAHPPLEEFPRDPEMAKLGITATPLLC